MEEASGVPTNLVGLEGLNLDAETLRLENLLRGSVQPRLVGVQIRQVALDNGRSALVLRIPPSFRKPHRVEYQGWNKFFVRTSAGAHEVSVDELRDLFLLSSRLEERVRAFRVDRLATLKAGLTLRPVVLRPGIALHVVPLSAFTEARGVDVVAAYDDCRHFNPIGASGCSNYLTFDGLLTTVGDSEPGQPISAYCLLFRDGCVETVRGYGRGGVPVASSAINLSHYEELFVTWTFRLVTGLTALGVPPRS